MACLTRPCPTGSARARRRPTDAAPRHHCTGHEPCKPPLLLGPSCVVQPSRHFPTMSWALIAPQGLSWCPNTAMAACAAVASRGSWTPPCWRRGATRTGRISWMPRGRSDTWQRTRRCHAGRVSLHCACAATSQCGAKRRITQALALQPFIGPSIGFATNLGLAGVSLPHVIRSYPMCRVTRSLQS